MQTQVIPCNSAVFQNIIKEIIPAPFPPPPPMPSAPAFVTQVAITSGGLVLTGLMALVCVAGCALFGGNRNYGRKSSRFVGTKLLRQDKMSWKAQQDRDFQVSLITNSAATAVRPAAASARPMTFSGWTRVPS